MKNQNIIELNKEVEEFVIQAPVSRSTHTFKNKYTPLSFVHCADMHNVLSVWNRMVEYVNHYSDYISFIVHSGDYCGGSQKLYTDFYADGTKCVKPIYNCVGNHDCFSGEGKWALAPKSIAHSLLFNHADGWDVNFMDCPYSMSYYKDFPESNLRFIILDDYYNVDATRAWLKNLLSDALEKGLHVVTVQHERTGYINKRPELKYCSIDDYQNAWKEHERTRTESVFDQPGRLLFEDLIADFIAHGGNFVFNLCGHDHIDDFGYTDAGVLNLVVENGTTWDLLGDKRRVLDTRAMDCFNVVAIDVDLGIIKVIRVGACVDHYMRKKLAFCYDYINKRIISEV